MPFRERQPLLRSNLTHRCQIYAGVFVLFLVFLERVAFYSLTSNLYLFLTQKLYNWTSYNAMEAALIFTGITYVSCLLGGIISDSYLGRLRTIFLGFVLFSGAYWFLPFLPKSFVGGPSCQFPSILLNSTVPDHAMYEEPCSGWLIPVIIFAAIGSGSAKANIVPFGVEQVRHRGPEGLRTYLFWLYWCINFGSFVAILGIAYVQQAINFFYGYLAPASCITIAAVLLAVTSPIYVSQPPVGSVFSRIFNIIREAYHSNKRFQARQIHIQDSSEDIQSTQNKPSFLDMAKVSHGGKFHEASVEDVKSLGTIIKVFAFMLPYWVLYFQMQTTFLDQGLHMKLGFTAENSTCSHTEDHFFIPAAWLSLLDVLLLIILIPVTDRIFYPWLNRRGWKIPLLWRMKIGMLFASISMLIAGILEFYRSRIAEEGPSCQLIENTTFYVANMTIAWQIPQYSFMGVSEVFASIAGMEFACSQAPLSMQGAIMGLFYFFTGVGSFLGSVLLKSFKDLVMTTDVWDINSGKLYYYFFFLFGVQFVTLILFYFVSLRLKIRTPPVPAAPRLAPKSASVTSEESYENS